MDEAQYKDEAVRLRPAMMAVARRYLADSGEAEDVVQDALLRLWQLRGQVSPPVDMLLRVVVRNLAVDRLRRRHAQVSLDRVELADDATADDGRYVRVMRLMEALPSVQQVVMRMRHMEGMEYDDIARLIGSTPSAVRQMVSRARRTILSHYREADDEEPETENEERGTENEK